MKTNKNAVGIWIAFLFAAWLFIFMFWPSEKQTQDKVVSSAVASVSQKVSTQGATPEQTVEAIQKVQQAVLNHPEPIVREVLLNWITSGRVLFAANTILPEMLASLEKVKGKDQVLLWYNINFVLNGLPEVAPADKQDYLRLVLYHECIHLDDHFSGRLLLYPMVEEDISMSKVDYSNIIWDREWSAVAKEWQFAKRLGKPYLVPEIFGATKNGDTPRNFLEGFYNLQMHGIAVAVNPSHIAGMKARYQAERAKLLAR